MQATVRLVISADVAHNGEAAAEPHPANIPSVDDLAAMAVFLASDASSCVTGMSMALGGTEWLR
jgi:enoyl-[acyl-carrier-protein] reductase (NADH)